MAHHVIYLPGVGDHQNAELQIKALQKWRKFGLVLHFQAIGWNSSDSYETKLNKILKIVDELAIQHKVSLVGVSAGASMAVNVYAARKSQINAAVLICGKINNPQTLGSNYKTKNPALFDSVGASAQNVSQLDTQDKQKMLTIFPIFDGTVAKKDATIPGIKNKTMFSVQHVLSIYLALTLYRKISINFLKAKAVQ